MIQTLQFAYKNPTVSLLYCPKLISYLSTMVSHWTRTISVLCVSLKHMDLALTMPSLLLLLGLCTRYFLCLPVGCPRHFIIGAILFFTSQPEAHLPSKEVARLKYLSHHSITSLSLYHSITVLIPCRTVNLALEYFLLIYYLFSLERKLLKSRNLLFFLASVFPLPETVLIHSR